MDSLEDFEKEEIGLIGGGFQHAFSSTLWKKPKYIEFVKQQYRDITFFVDWAILEHINSKGCNKKIGWVLESRNITPGLIEAIKNNKEKIEAEYDLIITHNKELYSLGGKFVYAPPHGYWIENPQIYSKTKLVSMISSNKSTTPGHQSRLKWVDKLKDKVDLYGFGFNEFTKKEEVLKDYMFSVTIENDNYETYWTEKILDCFATGTVPIYYGSPDIFDHFNKDGIILLDDEFDILELSESDYEDRKEAIQDNFQRSLKFDVIEDLIYEKWLNK